MYLLSIHKKVTLLFLIMQCLHIKCSESVPVVSFNSTINHDMIHIFFNDTRYELPLDNYASYCLNAKYNVFNFSEDSINTFIQSYQMNKDYTATVKNDYLQKHKKDIFVLKTIRFLGKLFAQLKQRNVVIKDNGDGKDIAKLVNAIFIAEYLSSHKVLNNNFVSNSKLTKLFGSLAIFISFHQRATLSKQASEITISQ